MELLTDYSCLTVTCLISQDFYHHCVLGMVSCFIQLRSRSLVSYFPDFIFIVANFTILQSAPIYIQ